MTQGWEAYLTPRTTISQASSVNRQHHPAVAEYLGLGSTSGGTPTFEKVVQPTDERDTAKGISNRKKRVSGQEEESIRSASTKRQRRKQPEESRGSDNSAVPTSSSHVISRHPESLPPSTSKDCTPVVLSQETMRKLDKFRYQPPDDDELSTFNLRADQPVSFSAPHVLATGGMCSSPNTKEQGSCVSKTDHYAYATVPLPRLAPNDPEITANTATVGQRGITMSDYGISSSDSLLWDDAISQISDADPFYCGIADWAADDTNIHAYDQTEEFTASYASTGTLDSGTVEAEDNYDDCFDEISAAELAQMEEMCQSARYNSNSTPQNSIERTHSPSGEDEFDNGLNDSDFLEADDDFEDEGLDDSDLLGAIEDEYGTVPDSEIDSSGSWLQDDVAHTMAIQEHPVIQAPGVDTEAHTAINGQMPSHSPTQGLYKPFKSPLKPKMSGFNHPVDSNNVAEMRPIVRPPFPAPTRDRSPIIGLSPSTCLRTCFRIGEAIKFGCGAVRNGKDVIIELYARVLSSQREGVKQHFVFCDLFHDRNPHINGVFEMWKGSELWDFDSSVFLDREKMICRCIGKMKRDGKGWKLQILSIWAASWEDVEYVRGIVCA